MRDQLIGYLLEALEPDERQSMEEHLARDPQLRQEFELLSRALDPLRGDRGHYEPPHGLATRTCEFVQAQVAVVTAPPAPPASRWRMMDLAIAAGICLAASALFFPAVNQSRYSARLASCQNNLRQLGISLAQYSRQHGDYFPDITGGDNESVAGVYTSKLLESHLLGDKSSLICPNSPLAEKVSQFQVPTLSELRLAKGSRLTELQKSAGGSYGYNLGYVSDGKYFPTKNRSRANFPIMADAPRYDADRFNSLNHDGVGQNVLFEDGHVLHLNTCKRADCNDDFFINDDGEVAAGKHEEDAVIGASHVHPLSGR